MIYCNLLYNCTPAAKLNTNTVAQWNTSMLLYVSKASVLMIRDHREPSGASATRGKQRLIDTARHPQIHGELTEVSTVCILIFCMNVSTIHVCNYYVYPFELKVDSAWPMKNDNQKSNSKDPETP